MEDFEERNYQMRKKKKKKKMKRKKNRRRQGDDDDDDDDDEYVENRKEDMIGNETVLKGIVYAGGDGILTTLAIISGAYGGNLSNGIVLTIGISNCVADALNMGLGDLLSGITEAEHFAREKKIFEEEVRRHPEDEMDNLRQIFVEKGMSIPDAHDLVDMIASNQNLFIEVLMNQELGLIPSNVCGASRESFVTFMSFLCFSMIPLFSYVTFPMIFSSHIGHTHMFAFSLIITSIGVFSLGFLKGMYSRKHSVRMGLEMLVQGATISLVAYLVGRVVSKSWS